MEDYGVFERHYHSRFNSLVLEHPGEWLVICGLPQNPREEFYTSQQSLESALEDEEHRHGETYFISRIPENVKVNTSVPFGLREMAVAA